MDLRRGCAVPEVGLGTSYQPGPEASPFRIRGYIDVSKLPPLLTVVSNY